jgi:hypothetical protein
MRRPVPRAATLLATAAIIVGLLAAPAPSASAQDEGWTITSFDAEIIVAEDGSFTVVEEIVADFGPREMRGIFRTIPTRYRYDDERDRVIEIDRWSVTTSAGAPDDLRLSDEGTHVEARIGDPDTYITGQHTYRIAYRVRGALNRFQTHDELFWEVTGHGWDVPIEVARATPVGAPGEQATCLAGPPRPPPPGPPAPGGPPPPDRATGYREAAHGAWGHRRPCHRE